MMRNGAERQNYVLSLVVILACSVVYSTCPLALLGRYFIRIFGSVISMNYFHK